MKNIVLQTKNLTKKYGDFTALDRVSVSLKKKHIYGFIGGNGAGKSTFMKIITGLSCQTEGDYSLLGKEREPEREKMRKYIGSMIEAPALYPNYSVFRNLELQRILVGNPDKTVCDKVLDKMYENPKYKVISDNTIHLYSNASDMETISKAFMQNNIVITELSVKEQSLEDYYISITGGADYV